jgi:hypothetical protein
MKERTTLGIVLSMIGVLVGLVAYYLFSTIYHPMQDIELAAGRPDEALVVKLVFPLLGYMAIASAALWGLALYGFLTREKWAWMPGMIGATFSLLAGFFPMIPAASRGAIPVTGLVFFPSIILWAGLLLVRRIPWKISLLAFSAGLAYVLAFMDGVATIDKIQITTGNPSLNGMYVMSQQINWWGAAGWAIFIFALFAKKTWARPLGIGAGLLACLGGYPLAVATTIELQRFSMFTPSPLLSTALILILMLPVVKKLIKDWNLKTG